MSARHITNVIVVYTLINIVTAQLATWSSVYDLPVIREPKPGWARFCKGENVYDTFANQCPVGIFWDKSHDNNWDCVCTRGPWRRSASWCSSEDTQRFTQGDITCFKPAQEEAEGLQAMYYLGDRFSAWDSSSPILLTDYRSGIPIRKGDFNQDWQIISRSRMAPGILIYRPRDDWAVEDKSNETLRLCLRAPDTFDEETEGLFIYNITMLFDSSGGSQSLQLSFTRGCYSWNDQDRTVWYEVIGENLEYKNMIVPGFNNKSAPAECIRCVSSPIPPTPESDIDGEPLEEREEFAFHDLKNIAVLKTEIDLQTERLGLYWVHRMLQNGSDYVQGDFQELDILTKSAIMAFNACDSNSIPFVFYQYFLMMFRMLLSESFKKYAPKAPISEEYYARINELLEKCKQRTTLIKFTKNETCPPLYETFEGKNGPQILNISMDYTSDKGRHDYLLEFIWRLKSFLHYSCFEEFQMDSTLHDIVQHQLESLFTEDLILRWFNPGNSIHMYELMFATHLNLDNTMRNFQRCVVAVHDMSKYPVWLKRPIDRPEVKPRPGSGGLVRFKRNAQGSGHQKSLIGRRKRDADTRDDYDDDGNEIKPPNNLFAGKAACIKSIRNFMHESTYKADASCW